MADKGKLNIVGIVAWVLVGVLVLAAGALGFLGQKQAGQAAGLREAFSQVATTAGVADLAGDALTDEAALADAQQKAIAAIQAVQQELASTKEALTLARNDASAAKTESGNLSQQVQEATQRAENLAKDLAAKDEAAAAAKAEAEKAAQEAQAAQEAAGKKQAELEETISGLKAQMAQETARLEAELEAAKTSAAAGDAEASGEETLVDALGESAPEMPVEEELPGRVIGQSTMFSLIRYDETDQSLSLRLLDGQELTYRDVPPAAFSQLVSDGARVDMVYKFKVQGAYKSIPPDSTVVRKYLKWQRRNRAKGDVRVVEVEAPLAVVDEAPAAGEAAVAEEPANEAAPEE